ncbi:MAG: oxidoreductase [Candidatus Pseudomonas phytovorans]|uniref:Oxidoreductase n=1 Tax=Candidatus Pseudomonas phytovorans TaxID=3121377 RepID=A0AAJ6BF43_9PSED|nr:oxidoreductase [Pseudomonas sp.]WEK33349.1 MAG: oxidoreductase [Pseudomonas sp.]
MKLGEYYALQSAHLRELQHKANASIAEARDRMHRNIDDIDIHSTKAWSKVRPIIQHGLMSLAVLDPRFTNTMISVSVWVEGTAAEVHGRLLDEASMKVTQASSLAQRTLVDISVAAGTLEADARKMFQRMKITSQQAAELVRTGFGGMRGVAGSWELLLAIGGLYLQYDSLARNQEKAEVEIGPKAHEAKLALQGAQLGILGGQIELIGLVMRSSASYIKAPWPQGVPAVGGALVKFGALFSAIAGVFETAQAKAAAKRASAAGDSTARTLHVTAAAFYGIGAAAFAGAVFKSLILGPLGIAILLSLTAYALSKQAEKNESSALERWARRCWFGKADETPAVHWNATEYADIAFAELNAAVLGVQAKINFDSSIVTDPAAPRIGGLVGLMTEQRLRFQVVLPNYRDDTSAFRWGLIVHRVGDGEFPEYKGGETIIVDDFHAINTEALSKSTQFSIFTPPRIPDYKADITVLKQRKDSNQEGIGWLEVSGTVELMPTIGKHTITGATLLVMYWPDRIIPSAYIEICERGEND